MAAHRTGVMNNMSLSIGLLFVAAFFIFWAMIIVYKSTYQTDINVARIQRTLAFSLVLLSLFMASGVSIWSL